MALISLLIWPHSCQPHRHLRPPLALNSKGIGGSRLTLSPRPRQADRVGALGQVLRRLGEGGQGRSEGGSKSGSKGGSKGESEGGSKDRSEGRSNSKSRSKDRGQ